jgi:hypothetical protein
MMEWKLRQVISFFNKSKNMTGELRQKNIE